ncbi:MAG TPA: hypothetical protein DEE98_00220 [Elusimicrobia bacterium]|nr:MAG: hypothetical protein A2278_08705 [Elusimicrobia bacterium RIFOXYA12_FULL_49_49]OGS14793.1 MAG: hypothetical protein A2251_09890 [Elusimicrobia bacterium RIFOXYA2_FULL_47_53]OGS25557.1 MAG: hypothetical protein A2339_05705 [Elusimicrobia bacterium RIFOXYB12_FULL_50_12]OGS28923.1 MAG: hypothetical protein A2323_05135 [Elusimicrobia bacterium RIFOXYB2_FULL_46_23]HBU68790.1 hypothetical protein [Elusimicrobiota bacterium]
MFNYFDLLSIILIVFGAFFGFQTGIIASIFYIASGFAGMWAADRFAEGSGIGFYLIFAAGAGVLIMIGFIAGKLLKAFLLGTVDRVIGLVLGIMLGCVIVGVVVLPVSRHMPAAVRKAAFSSFSGAKIIPFIQKLYPRVKDFDVRDIEVALPMPKLPEKIDLKLPLSSSGKKK